ncbi:MAG: hypothetical protein IPO37_03475 [Saprospiraceae bacterium]|nr:hypothetical protein [Saprospiraceae bacterium]MBP6448325.1 hypothetical protein [Saprospiraceae bacterium]
MIKTQDDLIGDWMIDPDDEDSINELGMVCLKFSKEGVLKYIILGEESDQVILLLYEDIGGKIVTCQPSDPRKEETVYYLNNNILTLMFNGQTSKFIRVTPDI